MNWWVDVWLTLLPFVDDGVTRSRIGLIITLCVLLSFVALFLITSWYISGDLQRETVYISIVYLVLLSVISLSAYFAYWQFASWVLILILTASVAIDTFYFGVSSPASSSYVIPIVLASFLMNLQIVLVLTIFILAIIWFCALAELTEWYVPQIPKARSHRTFNAPVMTVTFFLIALLSGLWSESLVILLS